MTDDKRTYWAAELEPKKFIARALERFEWRQNQFRYSGNWWRAQQLIGAYYGRRLDSGLTSADLRLSGEQGEVIGYTINGVRPVVNTLLGLIFGNRPAVKPVAENGDAESLAATRLAAKVWQDFQGKLSIQDVELNAIRGGLLASEYSIGQAWQPKGGEEWSADPETGEVVYSGDINLFLLPPWRVSFDPTGADQESKRWVIFCRPVHKWDTIARTNDEVVKEKLINGAYDPGRRFAADAYAIDRLLGETMPADDTLWVWEVRHLPSPALPGGRLVRFVEPDIILFDSAAHDAGYPYDSDDLHAYTYCPEQVISGQMGHTSMFDLLGTQRVLDIATTATATSANLLGMPFIWQQKSSGAPDVTRLSSGPSIYESETKPEKLQFDPVDASLISLVGFLKSTMTESAALNDTVMGRPGSNQTASGQALQRAQAVQFNQVSQAEAIKLVKRNANGILKLSQRFADTPRELRVASAGDTYEVMQWNAAALRGVKCFDVEVVDPMSNSFEYRQTKAEMLIQSGNLKPEDLPTFLETGTLDSALKKQKMSAETIERNQALLFKGIGLPPLDAFASAQEGQPVFIDDGKEHVIILKSDNHKDAIDSYLAVINSPMARTNEKLAQVATEAVNESKRLWESLTPNECIMFGVPMLPTHQQQLAAPPMMPPGPGGPEMAPPGMPPMPNENVKLPAPPENPLTGEQEEPSATGLKQ